MGHKKRVKFKHLKDGIKVEIDIDIHNPIAFNGGEIVGDDQAKQGGEIAKAGNNLADKGGEVEANKAGDDLADKGGEIEETKAKGDVATKGGEIDKAKAGDDLAQKGGEIDKAKAGDDLAQKGAIQINDED